MAKAAPRKKPSAPRKAPAAQPAQRPPASPPPPLLPLGQIVAQDRTVNRLQKAMELARLPHALLFWGPPGVGKETTARSLAAALLCSAKGAARKAGDSCGQCEDCRMMQAGTHPDYTLIYKELAAFHNDPEVRERKMQELGIPVIRSFLIAPAASAAARGRGKVFVVLESELMNAEAQNSLLKTLEEPPRGVTIILLAERPEELLPTTLSRCSLMQFGPLPADFVMGKLREAGVEESQARFWADLTEGSAGEALRLAKETIGPDDEGLYPVKRKLVTAVAGLGGGEAGLADVLQKLTEALGESAIKRAKAGTGAEMAKSLAARQGVAVVLQILASIARDAMRVRSAQAEGAAPPALIHSDQRAEVAAIAARFRPEQLADVLDQLAEYERLLWRNVSARILWDNVVITLSSAAPLRV